MAKMVAGQASAREIATARRRRLPICHFGTDSARFASYPAFLTHFRRLPLTASVHRIDGVVQQGMERQVAST
jgi:hypothetical protein